MPVSGGNAYMSKSLYMRGLQCHKSLYLYKHHPELRGEPTPELLALWKSGTGVGIYAHQLFPGGVEVPFEGLTNPEQLGKTKEEIAKGTEILYEVKSATEVKDHNLDDVAVQYYVLSGCGISLRKAYLVHINNEYVRQGEIVPRELFATQDVTDVVKGMQGFIPGELAIMRKMMRGKVPDLDIGPHCNEPFECDFMDHC